MIRLALPKGRNLAVALEALRGAGLGLAELEAEDRRLRVPCPGDGVEVLLLKNWDLPLYVEHGVADCGIVGSDVLEELGGDLLAPLRLRHGRCRLSLLGLGRRLPEPGEQVRLASKYPVTARRVLASRAWGAEVLRLSGSVELAPLLELAELALDVVQTGRTLRENGLHELEVVREVAPSWVVHRGAYQRHRPTLNRWFERLEREGLAE